MKLYRIVTVIIGSLLFIPVSCTVGTMVGIPIVAWIDSRNVVKGDKVHSLFSVVAESENDREQIIILNLSQIEAVQKSIEPVSFLLSKPKGNVKTNRSEYTYEILEKRDGQQIIEVIEKYSDGDNTIWSNYRATKNNIFPLKSKMFYFGYMFNAIFIGIVFCIGIFILGKILRRHVQQLEAKKNAA